MLSTNVTNRLSGIVLLITFYLSGFAQGNRGLKEPQPVNTLPRSRAQYVPSVQLPKHPSHTVIKPLGNGESEITGGWELAPAPSIKENNGELISSLGYNTKTWYNAVVPGTVLTSLVYSGVYPDPYFGLNNLHIPDSICRVDWWYRTAFASPAIPRGKHVFLNFNGINYKAEVWLNGKMIGRIAGAFEKRSFDVTANLSKTKNALAVHIIPPAHPGIPHEESPLAGTGPNGGLLCLDGPTFISSEGWDWVPGIRDRNIGIWQCVTLKVTGSVIIEDPQVITHLPLPDTSSAQLTINASVSNITGAAQNFALRAVIGKIKVKQQVLLKPYERKTIVFNPQSFPKLNIRSPRLWWPNGYGKPELYKMYLQAYHDKQVMDDQAVSFGIRQLTYEVTAGDGAGKLHRVEFDPLQAAKSATPIFNNSKRINVPHGVTVPVFNLDEDTALVKPLSDTGMGPYLVIKVNGKRIYCKGGNWGMDDAMKQVSRAHLEPYFKLHHDAHFNMVRNWTGESTEDIFYQLCDEYGLLVWNDFWLSTEGYNLNVADERLFMNNARQVIKRFRNHPSIALWCPRNEGYAPENLEPQLAKAVWEEDGTRYYQANSRYLNLRTSGPWHYFKNPDNYTAIAAGFSTELGTPSIPTAASIRKMMPVEDQWPISDTWYYHDFHTGQKDFVASIDSLYGQASSLDDFAKKAQMLNYESHRAMFEKWQSKMWNNTSGVLLWMTHPAWPSMVWQTYSWDYETFGSYFGAMKACEPVHIQWDRSTGQISVINTSLQRYSNCSASIRIFEMNGKAVAGHEFALAVPEDRKVAPGRFQLPSSLSGNYLVRLQLSDKSGKLISSNDYLECAGKINNFKAFNHLSAVKLSIEKNSNQVVTVSNHSSAPAIAIKLNLVDHKGHTVLPAYFSDGYFNLLPGESKQLTLLMHAPESAEIKASGYNVE